MTTSVRPPLLWGEKLSSAVYRLPKHQIKYLREKGAEHLRRLIESDLNNADWQAVDDAK